jgi:hypothetical protein
MRTKSTGLQYSGTCADREATSAYYTWLYMYRPYFSYDILQLYIIYCQREGIERGPNLAKGRGRREVLLWQ